MFLFSLNSVMRFFIVFCSVILGLHVGDEVNDTVGVTHFIVIPGKIKKIVIYLFFWAMVGFELTMRRA